SLVKAALADVIARARTLAASLPQTPGFAGFADGAAPTPAAAARWDDADAALRVRWVEAVFARASDAAGLALIGATERAVATTAGCRRAHRFTTARLEVIATVGDASAHAAHHGFCAADVDAAAVAERAVDLARRGGDATEIQPGAWDVVLAPAALA